MATKAQTNAILRAATLIEDLGENLVTDLIADRDNNRTLTSILAAGRAAAAGDVAAAAIRRFLTSLAYSGIADEPTRTAAALTLADDVRARTLEDAATALNTSG